jgi:uroporphyrinogen decarboxylase
MNSKERILAALRLEIPDRVPVFEWFIDVALTKKMLGTDDPVEVTEQLDLDAINVRANYKREFIDDTTLIDEWGIKRKLTGDAIPALLASPIEDVAKHADYTFPDPEAPHRYAALEKAVERFGDRRAVIWNLRDGFSDMRDLLGYEGALMALLIEPEAFSELLDRSIKYNLELARIAKERFGIEVVATTDDVANADGMLMRPETYFELLAPKFKEVFQGYKELGYLTIKHCDGNVDEVLDFWIESGIDCLDPVDPGAGEGYTMANMKARVGDKICLKGNVDCTGALCDGTAEQVIAETRACLAAGGPGGGYIISSSNTIHQGVKAENFKAMLDAVRKYGAYPNPGEE